MTDKKLLVFSTPTCTPCKLLILYLESKNIPHEKIDLTTPEGFELSRRYGTGRNVPVTILVKDDEEIDRVIGFSSITHIDKLWEK